MGSQVTGGLEIQKNPSIQLSKPSFLEGPTIVREIYEICNPQKFQKL